MYVIISSYAQQLSAVANQFKRYTKTAELVSSVHVHAMAFTTVPK